MMCFYTYMHQENKTQKRENNLVYSTQIFKKILKTLI